ncbi:MAG: DUF4390 domain-containing protein [Octadecabacter sp.]|nr:DUF4390 domain-containing protein [Octadecabacter sp.]
MGGDATEDSDGETGFEICNNIKFSVNVDNVWLKDANYKVVPGKEPVFTAIERKIDGNTSLGDGSRCTVYVGLNKNLSVPTSRLSYHALKKVYKIHLVYPFSQLNEVLHAMTAPDITLKVEANGGVSDILLEAKKP